MHPIFALFLALIVLGPWVFSIWFLLRRRALNAGSPFSIAPAAPDTRRLRLEFTADGTEYFRIWVVNVFLSVISLGIYSAWAKVRRIQYFYAHTRLDGTPFEYLASPAKILKGRVIVVGMLAILIAAANFSPHLLYLIIPVFLQFFPWLINKALMFKTRNTAYRNIRFNFTGTYRRSYWVFVVLLALSVTGWLYPLFHHRRKRYIYNNIRYGRTSFQFQGEFGPFYGTWFKTVLVGGIPLVFLGLLIGALPYASETLQGLCNLLIGGAVLIYIHVTLTNYSWQTTNLGDIRFDCTLDYSALFFIYLKSIVLIILTAGVYIPWAKVRLLRYRFENLFLITDQGLDEFVADAEEGQATATGEEVGEIFDLDFGL